MAMKTELMTTGVNTENLPVVVGVEIPLDISGRYNLNAIHKASGEGKHKSPGEWLRLKQTRELISELESKLLKNNQDGNLRLAYKVVDSVHGGSNPGTYAHELIAVSYAGWIRPDFQLDVNQAFIDFRAGQSAPVNQLTISRKELAMMVIEAEERAEAAALENKTLNATVESLEKHFTKGMTIPAFCKGLNGVNVSKMSWWAFQRKWLYNDQRDPEKNPKWRVASYARDKYLTEDETKITPHGQDEFKKFTPVLLEQGCHRLYQLYMKGELPMKKTWNGEYSHDKAIYTPEDK